MSDENPFEKAEPWETSTVDVLPPGNYVARIIDAEDGTSSKDNPQIELKLAATAGTIRDWCVYHTQFLGRLVALFDSAGIERPQPGEFDPETFRLTERCIGRLLDKQVGIVVREEPDYKDETKMRSRVKGYVEPSRITDDIPADTRGLPTAVGSASPSGSADDDDIPF